MANRYGITLSRVWTEWAAEHGVSETIAAALYLLSQNRKAGEVLVKLVPGEMERVIAFVQRWPDRFPPGALAALKNSRPTSSLEPSAAGGSPDGALTRGNVCPTRAYGPAEFRAEVQQRATEHATRAMAMEVRKASSAGFRLAGSSLSRNLRADAHDAQVPPHRRQNSREASGPCLKPHCLRTLFVRGWVAGRRLYKLGGGAGATGRS